MTVSESKACELAESLLKTDNVRAEKTSIGVSSEVFYIASDGDEYVLRIGPSDDLLTIFYEYRMIRREPAIHERLLADTNIPVPAILGHDFSRATIDRDFLIMPRLDGATYGDASLSEEGRDDALREWGRYVREIHGVLDPRGRYGYLDEPNCMETQATWSEAFAIMYRKLLDDCVGCGVYEGEIADDAMGLLEENLGTFDHAPSPALLHGDLWVSNLMVDSRGAVTGVIDFNRACWGDIEWDLAIAEYCGIAQRPFWEGYGDMVEMREGDAGIRRLFYLLYEHQKYIVISMSARRNDPGGAQRYAAQSLGTMRSFKQTGEPRF